MKNKDYASYIKQGVLLAAPVILTAFNMPVISAAIASISGVASLLEQMKINRRFAEDLQISKYYKERLIHILDIGHDVVKNRAEKEGLFTNPEFLDKEDAFIDAQLSVIVEAMKDTKRNKDSFYGSLYGSIVFEHNDDWDDQYFSIATLGKLSIRQLVLLKLIIERFSSNDMKVSITNPIISYEMDEMAPLFWYNEKGFEIKKNIQFRYLGDIVPTSFAMQLYKRLSLETFITEAQVSSVIDQMHLQETDSNSYLDVASEGNYAEVPND